MKTNRTTVPKKVITKATKYTADVAYGGFNFGRIYGNRIRNYSSCKESFISSLSNPLDTVAFAHFAYDDEDEFPLKLDTLHSFEKEFGIPLTRVDEKTKNYTVLLPNKKWLQNWATFGLFLELARASLTEPDARTWKDLLKISYPAYGDSDYGYLKNKKKLGSLWNPFVKKMYDRFLDKGADNCVFLLEQDFNTLVEDCDILNDLNLLKDEDWKFLGEVREFFKN